MHTVQVTCTLHSENGSPLYKNVQVIAVLSHLEKDEGLVVPKETYAIPDENGVAILNLFPNELGTESSYYTFYIKQYTSNLHTIDNVVVPNADCNLWEIVELDPYPLRNAGDIITANMINEMEEIASTISPDGLMQTLIYDPRGLHTDAFNLENLTGNLDGGTFN